MRVSHETIYQALFVQGRGELHRELARGVRTGRIKRRARQRPENSDRIPDIVMAPRRGRRSCGARPLRGRPDPRQKTASPRQAPWSSEAPGFLLLLHLPQGRTAHSVEQAMRQAVATLPGELVRTITWDQGKEMSLHA